MFMPFEIHGLIIIIVFASVNYVCTVHKMNGVHII